LFVYAVIVIEIIFFYEVIMVMPRNTLAANGAVPTRLIYPLPKEFSATWTEGFFLVPFTPHYDSSNKKSD
jgi:hypothetical protein